MKTTTVCDMCIGVNDDDDINAEVTDRDSSSGAYWDTWHADGFVEGIWNGW